MKAIIIRQDQLDKLFTNLLECSYGYDHYFMEGNETHKDFLKTNRYQMLQRFRSTLKSLKIDIENSELKGE